MKNGIARSEAAHPARDLEHHRFEWNADPQRGQDGGEAERVSDRHPREAQDREAADQNEDIHVRTPAPRYSIATWPTVSGAGSWKKRCVSRRSITNRR